MLKNENQTSVEGAFDMERFCMILPILLELLPIGFVNKFLKTNVDLALKEVFYYENANSKKDMAIR